MASAERAKLAAFEATLRPGTRMRWPADALGPGDAVGFEPGAGDLLLLSHAPSRRFLGKEPVHESLMIELRTPLADASPGPLRFGRIVYRAGTERLAYQATRAMGTLELAAATPARFVVAAALTFVAPELDVERAGGHRLSGSIVIERSS